MTLEVWEEGWDGVAGEEGRHRMEVWEGRG